MQKPYRFLVDRVTGYAEEAGAFLRRRRIRGLPFARVWREGGEVRSLPLDGEPGRALTTATAALIALAEPAPGSEPEASQHG